MTSCSVLKQKLGSDKIDSVNHELCFQNEHVKNIDVVKKSKVSLYKASRGVVASQSHPVRTRVFYNSSVQKTAVQGLMVRGNKWPVCNWGAKSAGVT